MTNTDLIHQQTMLQSRALDVVKELKLDTLLSQPGHFKVVGSAELGLMTYPDLDLEVVGDVTEENYWQVAKALFTTKYVKSIELLDARFNTDPDATHGLYIEVKYRPPNEKWKIDIWFKTQSQASTQYNTDWIKAKLTDERKIIILEIKNKICHLPAYHHTVFSKDIYQAVLEHNIKNIEEFKMYVSAKGIDSSSW